MPAQFSTSLPQPIVADNLGPEKDDIPSTIDDGIEETVIDTDELALVAAEARDFRLDAAERGRLRDLSETNNDFPDANGLHVGSVDDEDGTHLNGDGDVLDDVRSYRIRTIEDLRQQMEEDWDEENMVVTENEDGDDIDDDFELDTEEEIDVDDFCDEEEIGMDAPRAEGGVFGRVDLVMPRRSFKGARNIETVKDCNFLGARSEKVCSGSDDGHFFVWDKETGRLEGIWEGDGRVVNVMEQHPTLPLVAVSGIDNTVKMFAPVRQRPEPSFARLHLQDSIISANTRRPRYHSQDRFGNSALLGFLASRGLVANLDDINDLVQQDDRLQQCATQ
ncbi:MAG: hypothetical protein TREMPRED_001230 [Tremellales sp. Tagirdzhanova-0007]|nr:MAG: hypothetical protein TREMPRED_001230 [Tremellales sp. Tagirdzhanova-0007]